MIFQGDITFESHFCRKSPGNSPGFRRPSAARSANLIIIENNYKPAAGADFFLGHIVPKFPVIFQGCITFESSFSRKSPGNSAGKICLEICWDSFNRKFSILFFIPFCLCIPIGQLVQASSKSTCFFGKEAIGTPKYRFFSVTMNPGNIL